MRFAELRLRKYFGKHSTCSSRRSLIDQFEISTFLISDDELESGIVALITV